MLRGWRSSRTQGYRLAATISAVASLEPSSMTRISSSPGYSCVAIDYSVSAIEAASL
jgi:hypothetical protein